MAGKVGGGGGGKFDLGQNSDMNVTPFVDVMLVLLIIFMVTAPLATVSIKLDLPPPTNTPPPPNQKPPTVVMINDDDSIYVTFGKTDTRKTTLDDLGGNLAASLGVPNPQSQAVLIHATAHVKYGQFMAVINQLQTDGFYKVGLVSENLGDG